MREADVAVIEHACLPRTRDTEENRREAVHCDDDTRFAVPSALVEQRADGVVIRREDRPLRRFFCCGIDPDIAWDRGRFAAFGDRVLMARRTIAVDRKPRIALPYDD